MADFRPGTATLNITINRGDDWVWTMQITQPDLILPDVWIPVDITGWKVWQEVRRKENTVDPPMITLSTDTGEITIFDALNGIFKWNVPRSVTKLWKLPGVHDIKIADLSDQTVRWFSGLWEVNYGVTRAHE